MDKRAERTEKKRAKVLLAAIALFIEKGPKKVTMDDIASRANVSKMSVYKYFSDKESLYRYAAKALMEQCRQELAEKLAEEDGIPQRMVSCTAVLTAFIAQGYSSLCGALTELAAEIRPELELFEAYIRETILGLIREGKQGGLVRGDISDTCIYHYIDMGLSYFRHNTEYRRKMQTDPSFRNEFMAFLWGGIFSDTSGFQ